MTVISRTRTRDLKLAVRRLTHYSTLPSLYNEGCNSVYKNTKNFFSRYRNFYKIRFVGNTNEKNWVNFGGPVTSSFDKSCQKLLRQIV